MGTPAGVQVSYLSPQNYLEYKGAVLFPFGKNAFALGYVNGENPDHRIVTAYSLQQKNFLFGTSFSVVFAPVSPSLTVDAAVSFRLFENRYLSLVYNNLIYSSDTVISMYSPKASISASGPFPYLKNSGFDCSYYVTFKEYNRPGMENGGRFFVMGKIINSSVNYSVGMDIFNDFNDIVHERVEAGLGFIMKIAQTGAGLFSGFHYDLSTEDIGFYSNVIINPTMFRDRKAPWVKLRAICSSEDENRVYISIKSTDGTSMSSGIKNWTL